MTEQQQNQQAERLARIEANIERIALVLEKTTQDHETRIRELERAQERTTGVLKLVAWLGAPTTAGLLVFLSKVG